MGGYVMLEVCLLQSTLNGQTNAKAITGIQQDCEAYLSDKGVVLVYPKGFVYVGNPAEMTQLCVAFGEPINKFHQFRIAHDLRIDGGEPIPRLQRQ